MEKQIKTSIHIQASPEAVWKILTDFKKYREWNPFVKELSGEVKEGNQIVVKLPGMNFKPIVQSYDENREFSWLGHLWFKGLFDGHHQFKLIRQDDNSTLFEHKEDFRGILVKPLLKMVAKDTVNGFQEMNEKLKYLAEQQ
jgi:hypothetical protein